MEDDFCFTVWVGDQEKEIRNLKKESEKFEEKYDDLVYRTLRMFEDALIKKS